MSLTDTVELLLVEDNPNDRELTMRALQKHNLANRMHTVQDGAEALEFIFATGAYASRAGKNPKVILLDLKLPKVSGLDVLKKIKADPGLSKIPVVILTSSQQERDILESYQLGVNSYIVKPVDFTQFAKAIADLGFYWLALNQSPL